MKRLITLALTVSFGWGCAGDPGQPQAKAADKKDKGTVVELGDLKSTTPADWVEEGYGASPGLGVVNG